MHQQMFTHISTLSVARRRLVVTLLAIAFMGGQMAATAPVFGAGLAPVSDEEREQRFEDLASRLQLTEEQKPAVKTILTRDRESRLAVLRENGVDLERGDRPSLFTMRGMRSDLAAINSKTRAQLSALLSADQLATYDVIADERRAQTRARLGF